MLTPVVLADYADTIQLTDRAEARARTTLSVPAPSPTQAGGTTPTVAVPSCGGPNGPSCVQTGLDASNQAAALFNATNRRWQFSAVYSPIVTFSDLENGLNAQNKPQVLQSASGRAAWHTQFTRLSLSEGLSFGEFNSAYLFQPGSPSATSSPGQVPPLTMPTTTGPTSTTTTQLVPRPVVVTFGSTSTALTLNQLIGRLSTLSLSGGYVASGGLDEQSRQVMPLAYGPRADASYGYALSRTLRTFTTAHGELTDLTATQCYAPDGNPVFGATSCRPQNEVVVVDQGLGDKLDRSTLLSIDAGVAYTRFRVDAGQPFQDAVYPEGGANVTKHLGTRGTETLIVSATLTPLPDLRTGQILYGIQGGVTLIDTLGPVVTMAVDAAGGQSFPTDRPLASSLVRGDVEARFRTDRYGRVILVLGTSALWQDQNALGGFFSAFAYFAVTVSTPALRF